MKINNCKIEGCYLILGDKFKDNRGSFQEIYTKEYEIKPQQTNCSISHQHTLRGIHEAPYAKLVTCVQGEIYDVVVDLRKDSPTYKMHESFVLNNESNVQLMIPAGCGHGFYAIEDSIVIYQQDGLYQPENENGWHWSSFGIKWPKTNEYIVSEKDKKAPRYN